MPNSLPQALGPNAGFGEPLPPQSIAQIDACTFGVARTEINPHHTDAEAAAILARFVGRRHVRPLVLLAGGELLRDVRDLAAFQRHTRRVLRIARELGVTVPWLEAGNEPDLCDVSPARAAAIGLAMYDAARGDTFTGRLLAGSPSNVHTTGRAFLAAMGWSILPADLEAAAHWFAPDNDPGKTYLATRRATWDAVVQACAGRLPGITEYSYHTAPTGGIKIGRFRLFATRLGDAAVAAAAVRDARDFLAWGAPVVCWFQWNDGPDPAFWRHRQGLRAYVLGHDAAPLKPQGLALAALAAELMTIPAPVPTPTPPVPVVVGLQVAITVWDKPALLSQPDSVALQLENGQPPIPCARIDTGQWVCRLPPEGRYNHWGHVRVQHGTHVDTQRLEILANMNVLVSSRQQPFGTLTFGGRFILHNGHRFIYRGITAFKLLAWLSQGERGRVDDYIGFCAERKLTPRVLAMLDQAAGGMFVLDPAVGHAFLPDLLKLGKDAGIAFEIVSLANTLNYPDFNFERQIQTIGQICAAAGNAFNELGNELLPIHDTQSPRLVPQYLIELAKLVPSTVPVSLGSTHGPDAENRLLASMAKSLPNGYATSHDIRTADEGGWKVFRHPNDLGWIADDVRIYLVSDEPQRADVDPTPGRHMGTAMVCRTRHIGDTFHYLGGLWAHLPEGPVMAALDGRIQGWDLIPTTWAGVYRNAGQGWPVRSFTDGSRCYSSVQGDEAYTTALDAAQMQIEWYADAKRELIAERDAVKVWHVTKG